MDQRRPIFLATLVFSAVVLGRAVLASPAPSDTVEVPEAAEDSASSISMGNDSVTPKSMEAIEEARRYDRHYPRHIGVCVGSQMKKRVDGPEQGWGHLVLFMRGACRDQNASYPRLKSCAPVDPSGRPNELMLSVNSLTRNVNWVFTEGKEMAFNGGIDTADHITQTTFDSVARHLIASGAFKGIAVHPTGDVSDPTLMQKFAESTIGTDTALTFGRDVRCAKIPMNDKVMDALISGINEQNKSYAEAGKTYQWDGIKNNCAHFVHNSLAKIGLWESIRTDAGYPGAFFNLAVPGNELVRTMDLAYGSDIDLSDPVRIFRDKNMRSLLTNYSWLPVRHGVIVESFPFHSRNDVFDGNLVLKFLELPFGWGSVSSRFESYTTKRKYLEVKSNLTYYQRIYKDALNSLAAAQSKNGLKREELGDFIKFAELYKVYLESQLADVEKRLQNPDALNMKMSRH